MPTSRRETFGSRRTSPGRGHKILAGALGLGLGLTGTGTLAASSAAAETPSIEIPANAVQNATTQNPDGTWSSYKTNSKIGLVAVTSTHEAYPGFDMTVGNKSPHYSAGFEATFGTRIALTTVIENQGDAPLTISQWATISYFEAQGLPSQAPVPVLEPGERITYDWSYVVARDLSTSLPGVTATLTTPDGVSERIGNRFQDTGGTGIYGYSRWVDEPMVTLTKEVNGVSATDPASAYVGSAGEEVTYTYTVTNNHPVEKPGEKFYPGATIRVLSLVDDDTSLASWVPVTEERGENEILPGQSVSWQATGTIGDDPSTGSVELAYMYVASPLRDLGGANYQLQAGSLPNVTTHVPTSRPGWNKFPAPEGFDPVEEYVLTPAMAAVAGDFGGNLNSGTPSAPAPVVLNAATFVRPAVAVEVTTQASANEVEVPADVYDTATVTGDVPEGAFVVFTLHKQGEGETVCTADNAIFESDEVVLDGAGDYVSQSTTITEAGTYVWFATVHDADGEILAVDECGAASETVVATDAPIVPEVPEIPEVPEVPEVPEQPEVPVVPEVPEVEQPEIEQPKIETPIVEGDKPVAPPTAPAGVVDLAHTGANAGLIAGLALLVVALGATLVTGARRRAG